MRHQRQVDRLALDAAGDYVRQADAERDAAKADARAAGPPFAIFDHLQYGHQGTGPDRKRAWDNPGLGLVELLHQERDARTVRLATADQTIATMERANERLADEVIRLSGRAIRAEQELRRLRAPPPLAIADMRAPRAMESDVCQ
jgi:hypothetical protein